MEQVGRLMRLLGIDPAGIGEVRLGKLSEIRLRAGRPMLLRFADGSTLERDALDHAGLMWILQQLTENSYYAHEQEMLEGYFSIPGGLRVGVCGRMVCQNGMPQHMNAISSVCIRVPHAVPGCADRLAAIALEGWPVSVLVVSPPGMGKTTLLRDYLRQLSDAGVQCAVVDERREIAACSGGMPQLDVGRNTDVLEGCPKPLGIANLVRSCSPQMIVLDEIGSQADAEAIRDAARCGVAVAASAHAGSIAEMRARRYIGDMVRDGIFDYLVLMGKQAGRILLIQKCEKEDGMEC